MDASSDESLFNIINTFTAGIELQDGLGDTKEACKMFAALASKSSTNAGKHNAFGQSMFTDVAAFDNPWAFGNDGGNKKTINAHQEVAGSIGNSDKSTCSFGSESNDSSATADLSLLANPLGSEVTNSFGRQFAARESSQSPAAFFGFSSSNSSSPPLSQNSSSGSSSLSEAATTTSTLKFNNSTTTSASSNNFLGGNNCAASVMQPFSSFAQAVAKTAFAAGRNSMATTSSANSDALFGTMVASTCKPNNNTASLDSFNLLLSSTGKNLSSLDSQAKHQQASTSRRTAGLENPPGYSQDSLPPFYHANSSTAANFNTFGDTNNSSSTTLPSLSNNRKLSLFSSNSPNSSNNSSLSSPILSTPHSHHHYNQSNGNNNNIFFSNTDTALQAKFEAHMRSLTNEINNSMQLYLSALAMRKEQLIKQMEHIRNAYSLMISSGNGGRLLEKMPFHQVRYTHPDQSSALFKSISSIGFLHSPAFGPYCQVAGEGLGVAIEGEPTCFMITIKNVFNENVLTGGDAVDVEIVPLETTGSPLPSMLSSIEKNILDNNNGNYNVTYIIPRGAAIRRVKIAVNINGLGAGSSPFQAMVRKQRVGEHWKRIAIYGEEGSEAGRFCRPWGVAMCPLPLKVDPSHKPDQNVNTNIPIHSKPFYNWTGAFSGRQDFLLAVADRSNNRIQFLKLSVPENANGDKRDVFAPPGFANANAKGGVEISVIHMFGSGPGTRPGQFDRPAGIAINVNLGHIVVADKDNHRVQVFDLAGNFQFKFGEKGSRAGQFCYPWDVAVCAQTSMILVSDTRNRRIQLFSHYGQYLWHCGQPLDSPRGVAFLSPDRYLVSDFNKHRLLIIDRNESRMSSTHNHALMPQRLNDDLVNLKYIGFGEGSAWGEFLRPQGIVASVNRNLGNGKPTAMQIICADSRNNRISIWNSSNQSFEYIGEESLKNDSLSSTCFDRPSGIAMSGNILAVVDFGFNRIQIFQQSNLA